MPATRLSRARTLPVAALLALIAGLVPTLWQPASAATWRFSNTGHGPYSLVPLTNGSVGEARVDAASAPSSSYNVFYEWIIDGVSRQNGVTPRFRPGLADAGKPVVVKAHIISGHSTVYSQTWVTGTVGYLYFNPHLILNRPVIGTPSAVGGVPTTANGNPVTVGYQWKVDGANVGTGSTYTPKAADRGKYLTVDVTMNALGYAQGVRWATSPEPVGDPRMTVTGSPAITGTAMVGSTLTAAAPSGVTPAPDSTSFTWYAGGTQVGTGASHVPDANAMGKRIHVEYRATKAGYETYAATSSQTAAVVGRQLTYQRTFSTSQPAVGTPITLNVTSTVPGLTTTYQWLVDGAPIAGATSASLTPQAVHRTKQIAVSYTLSASGYEPVTVTRDVVGTVPGLDFTNTTVAIAGEGTVGSELIAVPDANPTADSVSYSWHRGNTLVHSGPTYTPVRADGGTTLTLRARFTREQYNATTAERSVQIAAMRFPDDLEVEVTGAADGVALAGQRLAASVDTTVTDVTRSYEWRVDGAVIAGATGADFTPTASMEGQQIEVRATLNAQGYATATTSWHTVGVVDLPQLVDVELSVNGPLEVGAEHTATATASPAADEVTYTWRRGGPEGELLAEDRRYQPTRADVGHALHVSALLSKAGHHPVTVSMTTDPVARMVFPELGLQVSGADGGEVAAGATVQASVDVDVEGQQVRYEWRADGDVIDQEQSASLTPGSGLHGQALEVRALVAASGYVEAVSDWLAVGVVRAAEFTSAELSVAGTPMVGRTLTAAASAQPSAEHVDVRWVRNGVEVARGLSYTLTSKDVGQRLTVTATLSSLTHRAVVRTEETAVVIAKPSVNPPVDPGATVKVTLAKKKVKRGGKQTLRVGNATSGKSVKVTYRGKRIAVVKVNSAGVVKVTKRGKVAGKKVVIKRSKGKGSFTVKFVVGTKLGKPAVVTKVGSAAAMKRTFKVRR